MADTAQDALPFDIENAALAGYEFSFSPESTEEFEVDPEAQIDAAVESLQIDGCRIFINNVKVEKGENDTSTEGLAKDQEASVANTFIIQNVQILTTAVDGLPSSRFVGYQCSVCYLMFPTYKAFNKHQLVEKHYKENLKLVKSAGDFCVRCVDCFNGKRQTCQRCSNFINSDKFCENAAGDMQCSQCCGVFKNHDMFQAHPCISRKLPKMSAPQTKTPHVKKRETFDCNVCSQKFSTKIKLRNHHMKKHKTPAETGVKSTVKNEPSTKMVWQCTECKESFTSPTELVRHECIFNSKYSCDFCGEEMQGYEAYQSHVESCQERSVTEDAVELLTQDEVITVVKVEDGEEEEENDVPLDAEASEETETPEQCPICNVVIEDKQALEEHMQNHVGEVSDSSVDDTEEEFFPEERTWKCDICGKEYKSLSGLYVHKNIHSGKRFVCNFCGKLVKSYEGVKKHMLTHKKDMLPEYQQQLENGELYQFFKQADNDKVITPSDTSGKRRRLTFTYVNEQGYIGEEEMANKEEEIKDEEEVVKEDEETGKEEDDQLKEEEPSLAENRYNLRNNDSLISDEKNDAMNNSKSDENDIELTVECSICMLTLQSRELYAAHMKEHGIHACTQCDREYKSQSGLWMHFRIHRDDSYLKCQFCGKGYRSYDGRQAHLRTCHAKEYEEMKAEREAQFNKERELVAESYTCPHCPKTFSRYGGLRQHIKEEHPLTAEIERQELGYRKKKAARQKSTKDAKEEDEEGGNHTCPTCDKKFASEKKLDRHQKMNHQLLQCTECDKKYTTVSGLFQHKRHHRGKLFSCKICQKHFKSYDGCRSHTLKHQSGEVNEKGQRVRKEVKTKKEYMCSLCPQMFTTPRALKAHEDFHAGYIYVCSAQGCDRSYSSQQSLNIHFQEKHVRGRAHQCSECGRCFFQSSALYMHMRTHTGEKPFKCKLCQQPFRFRSALNDHMRSHLNTRGYACPHCDRKFNRSQTLKNHILTHTKAKPHRCEQCGACFSRRTTLRQHERTHFTTEFPCTKCGKIFTVRAHLMEHMACAHKPPDAQTCEECGERFTARNAYLQHLTTHADRNTLEELGFGQVIDEMDSDSFYLTINEEPVEVLTEIQA